MKLRTIKYGAFTIFFLIVLTIIVSYLAAPVDYGGEIRLQANSAPQMAPQGGINVPASYFDAPLASIKEHRAEEVVLIIVDPTGNYSEIKLKSWDYFVLKGEDPNAFFLKIFMTSFENGAILVPYSVRLMPGTISFRFEDGPRVVLIDEVSPQFPKLKKG